MTCVEYGEKTALKVSVITVCRNSFSTIEECIKSVVSQSYPYVEYIVIDGGSVDGTTDIIANYSAYIDLWVSENDKGISHALNKGVARANGDLIIFLHSDDVFADKYVISRLVEQIKPGREIFACDIQLGNGDKWQLKRPRGFTRWMNLKTGIFHQGSACMRRVFETIGLFDENIAIVMDYDFFLRAYRAGLKVQRIDMVLTKMRNTGLSSKVDWGSLKRRLEEERYVHKKNSRVVCQKLLYRLYWPPYKAYSYLKSLMKQAR